MDAIGVATSLIDGTYALITSRSRDIGGIIPDIVIEETGTDVLKITDFPVEVGATISDHAFKLPTERVMRIGCSDAGNFEGYAAQVYNMLLQLQASREPFDVSTGKRQYQNMLLSILSETTDEATEHGLVATVALREVIITYTQASEAGNAGDKSSPTNTGETQPKSGSNSPAFGAMTGLRSAALAQSLANGEIAP